ncbi:MAG: hypothetical protein BKP49_06040 [Treponema sp. CETP13]|nr:MAG: hypothetical protein BKP49_06040 [Treponema sp. CETP13]
MPEDFNFNKTLYNKIDTKAQWYNTIGLNEILTEYRNYHALIKNMFNMLVKKGLIIEDPYKKDRNVSDIFVPDDSDFLDNDKASIMGKRLSDYETSLDYLCNYCKFSINNFPMERIKTLSRLNNYIKWNSLQPVSTHPNTRALAELFAVIRNGSDQMSIKVLNDFTAVAKKTIALINIQLKELLAFQKQVYKASVRKALEKNPNYSNKAPNETVGFSQIKKAFPSAMGKKPFYKELIIEIAEEEFSATKEIKRRTLLDSLSVKVKQTEKKTKQVNTKELLMNTVRALGSLSNQLEEILKKMNENQMLLENETKGFWDKLSSLWRKAFHIEKPKVEYRISIEDPLTHLKKHKLINFSSLVIALTKRANTYSSFSVRNTPGFMKIESQSEEDILNFITKQIAECTDIIVILEALTDFFKVSVRPLTREKLKNWSIEITSMKNTLVKTKQRKAEYTSYIEEQAQMKRLGIIDE